MNTLLITDENRLKFFRPTVINMTDIVVVQSPDSLFTFELLKNRASNRQGAIDRRELRQFIEDWVV